MNIVPQPILDRLIDKITTAPIDPQPSDNVFMEDLFEPALYSTLISYLPPREAYDYIDHPDAKLPDGTSTRMLLDLTEETLARFHPESRDFWKVMNGVLSSHALQKAILHKFETKIRERFGNEWPEMITVPVFYKDFPGYYIRMHQDAPFKIATMQLYFPTDESQIHLGTSFHGREGDQFPILKTNPFKPNSGYAFARTDNSWHSVKQMGAHEAERNTLALTIYIKGQEYKSTRYV